MFHWSNTLLSVHYNGNWHIDQQNCVNYALKSSHHIHIWQSADARENMYSQLVGKWLLEDQFYPVTASNHLQMEIFP